MIIIEITEMERRTLAGLVFDARKTSEQAKWNNERGLKNDIGANTIKMRGAEIKLLDQDIMELKHLHKKLTE